MNSYELSRNWFDFCFENPERITPNHTALYFFCIEHCNRLGWKEKYGLPTTMAKEAIGIRSYNTYIKIFNDLICFGFIKLIEKSKNQYSSNIIALSNYNKALDKALDKAMIKHGTKQSESTVQSIDSIIKQINNKQYNNKQLEQLKIAIEKNIDSEHKFNFKKEFINLGVEDKIISDWLKVRSKKKASNTETAFNGIKTQIEKSGMTANECIKIAVENSWAGFKSEWCDKYYSLNGGNSSTSQKGMVY